MKRKVTRLNPVWLVVALLVVVPSVARPPSAQADKAYSTTIHIPATIFPACEQDEPVNVSGDLHIVTRTTIDKSGGLSIASQDTFHGTGVGLVTQLRYVVSETTQQGFSLSDPAPVAVTYRDTYHVISKGSADNLLLHVTMRVNVDPTGVPTPAVDEVSGGCWG